MNSRKPYIILGIVFISQMVVACWIDCPGSSTNEVIYNSVFIRAYDTSGFGSKEASQDSVHKSAFGVEILVNFDLNQISSNINSSRFSMLNTAYALDCDGGNNLFNDPIDYVLIHAVDTKTELRTDVSSSFAAEGYGNSGMISLAEFFQIREEWHDGFRFQLVAYDSIPSTCVFIAEAYLKSGIMFTDSTRQVNFFRKP